MLDERTAVVEYIRRHTSLAIELRTSGSNTKIIDDRNISPAFGPGKNNGGQACVAEKKLDTAFASRLMS